MLKLLILVSIMLWIHAFFDHSDDSGSYRSSSIIFLSIVIIGLIMIGFLS